MTDEQIKSEAVKIEIDDCGCGDLNVMRNTKVEVKKGYVCGTHQAIEAFCIRVRDAERERAAGLALNPYGDDVQAFAGDEPKAVGEKIAAAIREEGNPNDHD